MKTEYIKGFYFHLKKNPIKYNVVKLWIRQKEKQRNGFRSQNFDKEYNIGTAVILYVH